VATNSAIWPDIEACAVNRFSPAEALSFDVVDRGQLCNYLCTRDMDIGSVSSDLYVVSGDGTVIITWDHHTQTEGLRIDCAVSESSKLLAEMNNMGAEMEVFHSDGSPAA